DMRWLVVESTNKTIGFVIQRDGRDLSLDITTADQFNEQLQIDIGILGVNHRRLESFSGLGLALQSWRRRLTRFICLW
ncbi:MAG: hypothetical protein ACO208_09795, partial [Candidatus Puniceispirillaceae bacterium]